MYRLLKIKRGILLWIIEYIGIQLQQVKERKNGLTISGSKNNLFKTYLEINNVFKKYRYTIDGI